VQWGIDRAVEERVPVFAGGEERGVGFYEKALGFKRLSESEYWLGGDGQEISREEVQRGNEAWKTTNGGVSGSEVVWYPSVVIL
jgi:hypothetical protein